MVGQGQIDKITEKDSEYTQKLKGADSSKISLMGRLTQPRNSVNTDAFGENAPAYGTFINSLYGSPSHKSENDIVPIEFGLKNVIYEEMMY